MKKIFLNKFLFKKILIIFKLVNILKFFIIKYYKKIIKKTAFI